MNGLQYIRKSFGMTLSALGKRMGITRQTISQWEQGTYPIPRSRLNELSTIFGIPEKYFLDIKESDTEELSVLIEISKAQVEDSYLFSEYENLLKAERKTISKIDSYLKGKETNPETFQELNEFIKREIMRFEKFLDVVSCSEFQFILDPILDAFIGQKQIGGDRLELIRALKERVPEVLDKAEEYAQATKDYADNREKFDELY